MKPNRLVNEKSPYLLQHAYNPVDWYPWSDGAFEKARQGNRPVFLSIGYSTCHWCHVMERESFEDQEVAGLLNDLFISVKVDREERPDIDHVYMAACQVLAGPGGWPLTIMMTPDRKPFFAATYIPKRAAFGRPGLLDLLPRIRQYWETKRTELEDLSDRVSSRLAEESTVEPQEPSQEIFTKTFVSLRQLFDREHGGFGSAPKFPSPHNIIFLLRYAKRSGNSEALAMALKTLDAMADGGIHDHVGGGFHRYSTDAAWHVPHFEKMLYDQAMLCLACTEAYDATGRERYKNTAEDILNYVLRDMTSPEGGFYCGEDADSEGEEGRFYVWRHEEVISILGPEEGELICAHFDIRKEGNFIDQHAGGPGGLNVLRRISRGNENEIGPDNSERINRSLIRLYEARKGRIHPTKDDKILSDWNGLMIAAFAEAARVFRIPHYAVAAARAANFILTRMLADENRLLHRYRDGEAAINAYSDDYAFLVSALISLYRATDDRSHIDKALELNQRLVDRFLDKDRGGFFFTSADAESLLFRYKEIHDGAIPSANSAALSNLLQLSLITGDKALLAMASDMIRTYYSALSEAPAAYTSFITATYLWFDISERTSK